jgi:hypothetical protein
MSLAGRLAAAAGWPRPRPGAGCLVSGSPAESPPPAAPGSRPPPPR